MKRHNSKHFRKFSMKAGVRVAIREALGRMTAYADDHAILHGTAAGLPRDIVEASGAFPALIQPASEPRKQRTRQSRR